MYFCNIEWVEPKLEKLLSSNPNRSLSGIFKSLRKLSCIRLIADYPLLAHILFYGYYRSPQYLWNRKQILHAVKVSGFYKDEGLKHAYIPKEWEKLIRKDNLKT